MNTNFVMTILGMLVTNWTGYVEGNVEIGIVKSNTVAHFAYSGQTNQFQLLSEHTGLYVLREVHVLKVDELQVGTLTITNVTVEWPYPTNLILNR